MDAPEALSAPPFGPLSVRGCIARIDAAALLANLAHARAQAAGAEVLAVVKANAYGHGVKATVPVLAAAGVTRFGVATVEEGLELRELGVTGTILVLGGAAWWRAPSLLLGARLTPVFSSAEELAALDVHASASGEGVEAHVKIDTGMSRVGVRISDEVTPELERFVAAARAADRVRITGVCTHFANADLKDPALTERQIERYHLALKTLRAAGLPIEVAHVSNSAATLELHHLSERTSLETWVRPGLMLYGISPFADERHQASLSPVLSWTAPIVARKRVPPGTSVSYGSTWTAARDTELAVVGVGYVDGYPRALSGRAEVLVRGERAPVRGRVCMDLMVVDVTDVVTRHGESACALGEDVTLLGREGDEEIRVREVADWAETIPYEILTRIGARVPRVLVNRASPA